DGYEKAVTEFSKNLGVAFQILNDLKDWEGDGENKRPAGGDVLAARPTLLLALALEGLPAAERDELLALLRREDDATEAQGLQPLGLQAEVIARVGRLFTRAGVFAKAEKLVEKFRAKAEGIADEVEPSELRELLYFLVDSVLDRQPPAEPAEAPPLLQIGR
ncbi:MAG TPA: polyprenyl synthetase family protein, partial [Gemmataceae bacterium]|nr:polyprenyl synthetase family protein [Gemmataceae bacterium]